LVAHPIGVFLQDIADSSETSRDIRATGDAYARQNKETPMTTGTVKFYNANRGFGFIQPEDGSADVFVHATALEAAGMRGLVEGQKVSFEVTTDSRSGKSAAANLQAE